jgi:hypothetical protein
LPRPDRICSQHGRSDSLVSRRNHQRIRALGASGPSGARTRDLRIKSPRPKDTEPHENGCGGTDHVPRVPVLYVSAEGPRPADAGSTDAGDAGSSATSLHRFEAICIELLREARLSDSPRTRSLGQKLAAKVLAAPAVALAHQVLAGGPHATAKAVELADHLLSGGSPAPPAWPLRRPAT